MNEVLLTRNFVAFLLQTSVVAAVGAALPWAVRLRAPRPLYWYWQGLLGLILLLPVAQYWAAPARVGAVALAGVPLFLASARAGGISSPGGARWVIFVLVAGALLRMAWLGLGLWRLAHYRRGSERAEVESGGVEVRISRQVSGPVSFGVVRPVILLPDSWRLFAPAAQRLVVRHELIHIRRHDWCFHVAEEVIGALLWFHPAVWYAVRQIRAVREQVVDAEVIGQTHERPEYIRTLLAMADESRLPAPSFAGKHQLVERVRKLKKEYGMSKLRTAVSFAGVALVLFAGELAAIRSFPLQAAQSGSADKVYRVGNGVTAPRLLSKITPDYTEDARAAKVEGKVILSLEITPDGLAQNVQVKKSLEPGLDSKAVEAVYQWRFSPGTKDGQLVTVAANIEVNFRLK